MKPNALAERKKLFTSACFCKDDSFLYAPQGEEKGNYWYIYKDVSDIS